MIGLLSLPQKIAGGALAVLLLLSAAYGVREHLTAGKWQREADSRGEKLTTEQAKHAVTRMSLGQCLGVVDDQSAAARKLAADGVTKTKAAEAAQKTAQEAGQRADRLAAALDASAATVRPGAAACAPSDTFWNQRKEL